MKNWNQTMVAALAVVLAVPAAAQWSTSKKSTPAQKPAAAQPVAAPQGGASPAPEQPAAAAMSIAARKLGRQRGATQHREGGPA